MNIHNEIKKLTTVDEAKTFLADYRSTIGADKDRAKELDEIIKNAQDELRTLEKKGYSNFNSVENDIIYRIGELAAEE